MNKSHPRKHRVRSAIVWLLAANTAAMHVLPGWLATQASAHAASAPANATATDPALAKLLASVPENAVFAATWAGTRTPGFAKSKLRSALDATAMEELLGAKIPALIAENAGQDQAVIFRGVIGVMGRAWKYPSVAYFTLEPDGNGAGVKLQTALLIDAGADADAAAESLTEHLATAGGLPPDLRSGRTGSVVWLTSLGSDPAAPAAPGFLPKLAAAAGTPFSQAGPDQATVYLDVAGLLKTPSTDPQARELFNRSGLDAVRSVHLASGFDPATGDWMSEAFVACPSRTGIVAALFPGTPVPEQLLQGVPAGSTSMMSFRFDPVQWIEAGLKIAEATGQPAPPPAQIWGLSAAAAGVDVRDALLGSLDPDWVVYQSGGAQTIVALNRPRNPALAQESIDSALKNLRNQLLARRDQGAPQLALLSDTVDGLPVTTATVGFVSVSFAVKDGWLAVSTSAASVGEALKATTGPSLVKSPAFTALAARLAAPQGSAYLFADLPKTFGPTYSAVRTVVPVIDNMLKSGSVADLLPPADKLTPLMSPAGAAWWVDATGLHYRSASPFPGADLSAAPTGGVGGAALLVSILLPSLNRARETANRVKSASNLRQIGQAIQLHANEHRGVFPTGWADILKQDISPEVLLSPRTGTSLPRGFADTSAAEQAEWLDANGDFVYFGRGLNTNASPDVVVAHERLDRKLSDGINILFGDGRVEFVTLKQLPNVLAASKKAGGKH